MDFSGVWQTTDVFIFLTDWSAQYIAKSLYSLNENRAIPADRRHFCCKRAARGGGMMAFMELSWLNTRKAGKCQAFLKRNVRSYISPLFVPLFPPFCFHRLDATLSAVMSAPQGWVARCDPPTLHVRPHALFLFILYPHPLPWAELPGSSLATLLIIFKISGSEFRGGVRIAKPRIIWPSKRSQSWSSRMIVNRTSSQSLAALFAEGKVKRNIVFLSLW